MSVTPTNSGYFLAQIADRDQYVLLEHEEDLLGGIFNKISHAAKQADAERSELKAKVDNLSDTIEKMNLELEGLKGTSNDEFNLKLREVKLLELNSKSLSRNLIEKTKAVSLIEEVVDKQCALLDAVLQNSKQIHIISRNIASHQNEINLLSENLAELYKKKEEREKGLKIAGICSGTFSSASGLTVIAVAAAKIFGAAIAATVTGGVVMVGGVVTGLGLFATKQFMAKKSALSEISKTDTTPILEQAYIAEVKPKDYRTWMQLIHQEVETKSLRQKFDAILCSDSNGRLEFYKKVDKAAQEVLKKLKNEEVDLKKELENTSALESSLGIVDGISEKIAGSTLLGGEKEKKD